MQTGHPPNPTPRSGRFSSRFRRALVVSAIVVFLVGMYIIQSNRLDQTSIKGHIDALRALGEPVDLAAFMPKAIPDDENFAKVPWIHATLFEGAPVLPPEVKAMLSGDGNSLPARIDDVTKQMRGELQQGSPLPTDDLRRLLDPIKDDIATLQKAAANRPHAQSLEAWNDPEDPDALNFSSARTLTQLFQLHALASIALGDKAAAASDALVLQRLAETAQSGGSLSSVAVSSVISGMLVDVFDRGRIAGTWTPQHYEQFQKAFESLNNPSAFNRALRRGRMQLFSVLNSSSSTSDLLGKLGGSPAGAGVLRYSPLSWFQQALLRNDERIQAVLSAGLDKHPPHLDMAVFSRIEKEFDDDEKSMNPIRKIQAELGYSYAYIPRFAESFNTLGQATVVAALERYRAEEGRYPSALAELSPRYMGTLPADIFTGKPFAYRLDAPDLFVLYSIGKDGRDDGGDPDKDNVYRRK